MAETLRELGRLTFKREGDMWNAYYAIPDTPATDGALFLGGVLLWLVIDNRDHREAFMALMGQLLSDALKNRETATASSGPAWR